MDGVVVAAAAEALRVLRSEAYYADRVDWEPVERQVMNRARAGAPLSHALRAAFRGLGERHSRLRPADPGNGRPDADRGAGPLPEGRDLGAGVGYLRLPAIALPGPAAAEGLAYVRAAWAVLKRFPDAGGWVVDVRGNRGGTVHPMLAAVGPLLGSGPFLCYRRRGSWGARFGYRPGCLLVDGAPAVELADPPPDAGDRPVAVLHDERTASSAEGVVVAFRGRERTRGFGRSTAGAPTGTLAHRLPDGSTLIVAVSVPVDRLGREYPRAIRPDEVCGGEAPHRGADWLSTR